VFVCVHAYMPLHEARLLTARATTTCNFKACSSCVYVHTYIYTYVYAHTVAQGKAGDSEGDDYMHPQGMHLIPLPFNEDVRGFAKAQNIAAPPEEAVRAALKARMCARVFVDVCIYVCVHVCAVLPKHKNLLHYLRRL
jgi:hypothetical protein